MGGFQGPDLEVICILPILIVLVLSHGLHVKGGWEAYPSHAQEKRKLLCHTWNISVFSKLNGLLICSLVTLSQEVSKIHLSFCCSPAILVIALCL